ncbi:hypothetical protein BDD12DRAFT_81493 [Trichophaea hybrida]|nr:hypothetical protein BDD12DRAFT_81493 [Trichophaea hybrida]
MSTTRQYRPIDPLETKRDPAMSSRGWMYPNRGVVWTNKAAVETPGPKEPEDPQPRKASQKPEQPLYTPPSMRNCVRQAPIHRLRAPTNDGSKVLAEPTISKPFEVPPPDTNYRTNGMANGGRAQPHKSYQPQNRSIRASFQFPRVGIKARESQETFRTDTQQTTLNIGIGKTQKDFSLVSDRSPNKSGNSLGGSLVLKDVSPSKHHPESTMTQQDVSLLSDRLSPIKLGHGLAPEDVSPPKHHPESTMTQQDVSLLSDRLSPIKLGHGLAPEDVSPPKRYPESTMTQQDVSLLSDRLSPIKLGHGLALEDVSSPKRYPESTMTQQDVSLVSNGLSRIKLGDGIVPRNDSPPKPHPESAVVQEDVSLVSDRLSLVKFGNSSSDSLVPRNDSPPKPHSESAVVQEDRLSLVKFGNSSGDSLVPRNDSPPKLHSKLAVVQDVSLVSDRLSLIKFGNSLGDGLILRNSSPLKCEPESVKPLEDDTHLERHPVIIRIPTVPMRHSPDPPNTNLDMILRPIAERPSTFNNPQLVYDSSSSTGGVPLDISSDDSSATPTDSEDNDNSMSTIDLPEQSEFKGPKNQPLEDGSEAGSSCSTSTAAARPASACINKEAFYHQFSNVNALLPPVSPGGENTAESGFNTLIGNLKAGQNPQEHTSTEPRQTTATLVTPPVPFRPPPSRPRAERNISTRPLRDTEMSIPEWELPRCYICFQECHYRNGILQYCPDRQHQHQSILYREQTFPHRLRRSITDTRRYGHHTSPQFPECLFPLLPPMCLLNHGLHTTPAP